MSQRPPLDDIAVPSEERIEVFPDSIAPSYGILTLPSINPQTAFTLEVIGQPGRGFVLSLRDPMGTCFWDRQLIAEWPHKHD